MTSQPTTDDDSESPQLTERPQLKRTRGARAIKLLSIANLVSIVCLTLAVVYVSERWWLTQILTYSPRIVYLAPSVALVALSARFSRASLAINIAAIWIVVFPLMGFRLGLGPTGKPNSTNSVTIASCNVQRFKPDFDAVLREIHASDPDIVAFQEAGYETTIFENSWLADWNIVHRSDYIVASRFPLRLIDECHSPIYGRMTAIHVEVEAPFGHFRLINLHLMTARRALSSGSRLNVLSGAAAQIMKEETVRREKEALEAREFIAAKSNDLPLIVAGDFNVPSSSTLYKSVWQDLTNAFDVRGRGFGFTAPCNKHRNWFDDTPWLRIDHILVDSNWTVSDCFVGHGPGSDHRPIVAVVQLKNETNRTTKQSGTVALR